MFNKKIYPDREPLTEMEEIDKSPTTIPSLDSFRTKQLTKPSRTSEGLASKPVKALHSGRAAVVTAKEGNRFKRLGCIVALAAMLFYWMISEPCLVEPCAIDASIAHKVCSKSAGDSNTLTSSD